MNEIEKIKYHVKLLSEALDTRDYPIASLVIGNDWADNELDVAHDIFECFDNKLEQGDAINWYEFERAFEERLGIGYQALKSIVLAFFRNEQWTTVCREYASEHHCLEFSEITRESLQKRRQSAEEKVAAIFRKYNIAYSRDECVAIGNRSNATVDFLVNFPRARVAIEVKHRLNEGAYAQMQSLAKLIESSDIADEFWLVVDQAYEKNLASTSNSEKLKIFTLDEFEKELVKAP